LSFLLFRSYSAPSCFSQFCNWSREFLDYKHLL